MSATTLATFDDCVEPCTGYRTQFHGQKRRLDQRMQKRFSPNAFFSHISQFTRTRAEGLGITLVFLPVASPHLQLIEPVWNSLKRTISPITTESADDFRALVEETFRPHSPALEIPHTTSLPSVLTRSVA